MFWAPFSDVAARGYLSSLDECFTMINDVSAKSYNVKDAWMKSSASKQGLVYEGFFLLGTFTQRMSSDRMYVR
ncbi:hypothetical protein PQ610_07040 [Tardisphaera miroshnichenkoae]